MYVRAVDTRKKQAQRWTRVEWQELKSLWLGHLGTNLYFALAEQAEIFSFAHFSLWSFYFNNNSNWPSLIFSGLDMEDSGPYKWRRNW